MKLNHLIILYLFLLPFGVNAQTSECNKAYMEVDYLPYLSSCEKGLNLPKKRMECTFNKIYEIFHKNFKPLDQKEANQYIDLVFKAKLDGSIEGFRFRQTIDEYYKKEIIRLLKLALPFNPATRDDQPVCNLMQLTMEISDNEIHIIDFKEFTEEMPTFPGCEDQPIGQEKTACANKKMLAFIYSILQCPSDALENNISGTSVVRFTIDADGNIQNPYIVKKLGYGCDEEALFVVEQLPRFNPGIQWGEFVSIQFNLPIKFNCN